MLRSLVSVYVFLFFTYASVFNNIWRAYYEVADPKNPTKKFFFLNRKFLNNSQLLSLLKTFLNFLKVPTTAGTGSETTGVSIIDIPEKQCKTGIRLRCIKPNLAIIDPLNVMSMPRNVAIYSGFDVLCHALESYTAKPYNKRSPLPSSPNVRPVYQGSNPVFFWIFLKNFFKNIFVGQRCLGKRSTSNC